MESRLKELCLTSLGGDGAAMTPAMELALVASFGSLERWSKEWIAMSEASGADTGWLLLVFQPRDGTLENQWVAPNTHTLAGCIPLFALDMRERVNPQDLDLASNVNALLGGIHWAAVHTRYQQAVHAASEAFGASHLDVAGAMLLDVRREGVYRAAQSRLAGARWKDPSAVSQWAATLPADREIIAYCVYGHEVSRAIAMRLRAAGLRARYLLGGIDGWHAAGLTVEQMECPA
jgi:Fe-Mn family superoxide dismutase